MAGTLFSLISRISKIVDFAIPGDARIKYKEMEKVENYQLLQVIEKLWTLKTGVVVRTVIGGALIAVSDIIEIYTADLDVTRELKNHDEVHDDDVC